MIRAGYAMIGLFLSAQVALTQQGGFTINLRNTDITVFAEQISEITGRTLVLDPELQGEITVVSAEPLDQEGVWALFQSILRVRGFVAVSNGLLWEVVPEDQARSIAGPSPGQAVGPQDMVTRLVRLDRLPAEEAARVLQPLVDEAGYLEALPEPNALVVTDLLANVERIQAIAAQLDLEANQEAEVIRLTHAEAESVGRAIAEVLGPAGTGARLSVDASANVLLVRGTDPEMARIRELANALDVPRPAAPQEKIATRIFQLRHADAEVLADIIRATLQGGASVTNPVAEAVGAADDTPASQGASVQASSETNSILVRGTAAEIAEVGSLITALDVRRAQVMIEAAIVEVSGETGQRLGIQFGLDGAQAPQPGFAATSFSNAGASLASVLQTLGTPVGGTLSTGLALQANGNNFSVLLQALAQSNQANLLSTPSITTMDNQSATIVVGQNVPFRTGSFATDGNTVEPFTTIERRDVGITLKVLPRVTAGGVVRLDIEQEISSLVPTSVEGAADLITNRRVINTTVLAQTGGTVVLGGLITDDETTQENKVPGLGDAPIIGGLFRARGTSQTRRTLFIFMRPTVLSDDAATRAAATRQYQRLRQAQADETPRALPKARPVRKLPLEINGLY